MKRLILAIAGASLLSCGLANAADIPVKARPLPPPPPPCAQFGGFYFGGNLGYGYYTYNYADKGNLVQQIDDDLPVNARLSDDRWNGGVQTGYNWQSRCTLFGFEADYSWTNIGRSETFFDGDTGTTQDSITLESKMRSFGTLRARTGIIVDNVLLYVTGGFAYARFNRSLTVNEDDPLTSVTFSANRSRWGWTAGFGTEWQFAPNWSLKSEVLYMRFVHDEQTFTGVTVNGIDFGVPGRAYQINNQDEAWVTRIGINYRFDWGKGPVGVRAAY